MQFENLTLVPSLFDQTDHNGMLSVKLDHIPHNMHYSSDISTNFARRRRDLTRRRVRYTIVPGFLGQGFRSVRARAELTI